MIKKKYFLINISSDTLSKNFRHREISEIHVKREFVFMIMRGTKISQGHTRICIYPFTVHRLPHTNIPPIASRPGLKFRQNLPRHAFREEKLSCIDYLTIT